MPVKHNDYKQLLLEIKTKIQEAQVRVISAANSQLLWLYWQLGNYILTNQKAEGWGGRIIENLAADLTKELPGLKGFSTRNLKYMRKFAENYNTTTISNSYILKANLKKPQLRNRLLRNCYCLKMKML